MRWRDFLIEGVRGVGCGCGCGGGGGCPVLGFLGRPLSRDWSSSFFRFDDLV